MSLFNFSKSLMPDISVGIDIGNFSVKAAQIKQRRFSKEGCLSFGIREIKPESSPGSITQTIRQACNDARLESNKVNLSVYGPQIIMRFITLPYLAVKELSRCLEFELERYIPGKKKDNMVIDYKILHRLPNNQMSVFLIALERQIIEERLSLVRDAGLVPNSVNIDSLALMEAFNAMPQYAKDKEVTAILDIGHSVSKLVVFQGNMLYFSRDINNGIYNLIRIVYNRMNIDFSLTDELGVDLKEKSKDLYTTIRSNLSSFADDLRLSFEYCWRHLQKKVGCLYLSGGGSKLKMIQEVLATSLSLKTDILDVTEAFNLAAHIKPEDLKECGSLLTVAVGLATR